MHQAVPVPSTAVPITITIITMNGENEVVIINRIVDNTGSEEEEGAIPTVPRTLIVDEPGMVGNLEEGEEVN